MKIQQKPGDRFWVEMKGMYQPNDEQMVQFERYAACLLECNQQFNLTGVKDLSGVVRSHFEDSLALVKFIDLKTVSMIADIGSGAGFPGLPLKIMFPHLKVLLIEVTRKKRDFLADVVKMLDLSDVEISDLDWRTFVRKTDYPIDMFVTRAALDDLELSRMFQPACVYNAATLVYWASKDWEQHKKTVALINRVETYTIGSRERKLAFFSLPK